MLTVQDGLAASLGDDGRIYAIGGWDSGQQTQINTVEAYDPSTQTWAMVQSMPSLRQSLVAAASGSTIYAIGGVYGSTIVLANVEEYSLSANTWAIGPSMPTPRFQAAATAGPGGRIYVFGGSYYISGTSYTILSTVEAFTP
jgi:N-acetylneuraminic acid mutarotase